MDWEIHRWTGSLPLEIVTSDQMSWAAAPRDGVVWVLVHYPIGEKQYTTRLVGADNYYMDVDFDFGCWSNAESDYAFSDAGRYGTACMTDGRNTALTEVPELEESEVKIGVMVPDDVARQLGLL